MIGSLSRPGAEDRGQVGIGTLIVFIAMVLVAAIAAGVLINTAGFLQSQSEQTGQESTSQVTNNVQVVNTVGEDRNNGDTAAGVDSIAQTTEDGKLNLLTMTVTKSPGAEDIDLSAVSIEVIGPNGASTLTYADTGGSGKFQTVNLDGTNNNSPVLTDSTNQLKIVIDAGDVTALNSEGLAEGESATFRLTTDSGGTTTVTVQAPDHIENGDAVIL